MKMSTTAAVPRRHGGVPLILTLGALAAIVVAALALLAVPAPAARADNLPVYTSPIDITSGRIRLNAVAPHRDTGKPIEVPLPVDKLGPKMTYVMNTPLGTQMDQYWNATPDPETGLTPRQQACDGAPSGEPKGIKRTLEEKIREIGDGYSAYNVSCNLATRGSVVAKQVGYDLYVAYLLTNNVVEFTTTTPFTCKAGNGTIFCPNDPRFSVTFAFEIWLVIRTPSLCQLTASDGTVTTMAVNIDSHNASADIAKNIIDPLFLGNKFSDAEQAIAATERRQALPLDAALQELRQGEFCTSPTLAPLRSAFREFETEVHPRDGITFRVVHAPIAAPGIDAPNPAAAGEQPEVPSFTPPLITLSRPIVVAGDSVQVEGKFFPPNLNLATALPLTFRHGGYGENSIILGGGVCLGGATELEWGPAGGQQRVERLPGDAQGRCAPTFDVTNLTPATAYQFRARNCNAITCSPWSAPLKVTTARTGSDRGALVLSLGSTQLAVTNVSAQGTFQVTVTIPAGTAAGDHRIRATTRDARADAGIQVRAPSQSGSNATIMLVGRIYGETGCPNRPIDAATTGETFPLFGTGFAPGAVTIRVDSATGLSLGTVTAGADGSFCAEVMGPPSSYVGQHTLVAVQDGAVKATTPVRFSLPYVVR